MTLDRTAVLAMSLDEQAAFLRSVLDGSTDYAIVAKDLAGRALSWNQFLRSMAHDLRTPLNGIIGFAELMHAGRVGPISSTHREYLGDILTSARDLQQLINDVIALGRVEGEACHAR